MIAKQGPVENRDDLIARVRAHDGCLVPSPVDDTSLALDRYCRVQFVVDGRDGLESSACRAFLEGLASAAEFEPRTALQIDLQPTSTWTVGFAAGVARLAQALPDVASVKLRVLHDATAGVPWWQQADAAFQSLRHALHDVLPDADWTVEFEGCLEGSIPEEAAAVLAEHRLALRHACRNARDINDARCEDLLRATRFGLRIPVVFYADPTFLAGRTPLVARAVQASQYSGVALRAPWEHADFRDGDATVSTEELLEALTSIYREFPYYDDVLEPITEMARRVDPSDPAKRRIHVRIDRDGVVSTYRKVPAAGQAVATLTELETLAPEELRRRVLANGSDIAAADERCHGCEWRHVCRGMDASAPQHFESTCATWQLGLELLVWERWSLLPSTQSG
ncbi:MAG: hypothetical protein AAF682_14595 [Planctomycetota bacterium]